MREEQSRSGRDLGALYWPEVDGVDELRRLLVVPVGSLEQHGPHLPLDTDTRIACALTRSVPDAVIAPALAYGSSGEHEGFAGTVSIGAEALELVLLEYGRSAARWARRLLFVNGHGGNNSTLVAAVRTLRYEGRDAAWWAPILPGADAHAGRTETSLMLHLAPETVLLDHAEAGDRRPVRAIWEELRAGGVAAVSPNGVLGDPAGASAVEGGELLSTLRAGLRDAVSRWEPNAGGLLR